MSTNPIFTEMIPEVNHHAPRVFYIPECEEKELLRSLIEKHGGLTTELHECFTYQIHPLKVRIVS